MTGSAASRSSACLRDIDVAVLAGGLGTRIRAVLGDIPKILAPVDGRPFVDYLLDWLESFGAARVVFCLGHLGDKVESHLARARRTAVVEYIRESAPLGTGGALANARPLLRTSPVLVVNGDSFVDIDLCAFVRSHRDSGAVASLVCTEVADAGRYGRVAVDENSRILRFSEKDAGRRGPGMISAGMYLLEAPFLDMMRASGAGSIERDVFGRREGGTLHAYCGQFAFIDIGTPESLARATRAILRPRAHE